MIKPVPLNPGEANADLRKARRRRNPMDARAVDTIDRLPPHSPEAEQGVLGCIFLAPHECMAYCIEQFKVGNQVFFDLRHQEIYEMLENMYDDKEAIDVITVQQRLKDKHKLDSVGGIAYLASLPDTVPSAANISFYVNIVREKFILRSYIRVLTNSVTEIYEHEGEVDVLPDQIERDVLNVRNLSETGKSSLHIKDYVHKAIARLEEYHENQGAITGIATGFIDLDKMTRGFNGGEMIVIAARPSMGKTSLACNIAEFVAIESKLPVGIFSLEMSGESLTMRMICGRARVNIKNMQEGFFSERDFPKITSAAGKISNAPIYIDDEGGISIMQLRAKCRRMWQQHGIKLFVIDYLQLLHSTARRAENRQQEIADISSGIKSIAKELDVPVIVAAQLNRDLEKEKNRKPRMSDLRESGAIEQDADFIGLLYKPSSKNDEEQNHEEEVIEVNLLIAKQRNGPTGDVPLTFIKTYTKFESRARVSQQENLPGT